MQHGDDRSRNDHASEGHTRQDRISGPREPRASRAAIGKPSGLDWSQTFVLRAVGDLAMELWEFRLTLSDVEERLALKTAIARRQIEEALGPLSERGYLHADDAPGNPEVVLQLMPKGLDEYLYRFVHGYGNARLDVLRLICKDIGCDVHELSRRTGHPALLIEHILDGAQGQGLLRVSKRGQYITVTQIMPQLRRLVSGAA